MVMTSPVRGLRPTFLTRFRNECAETGQGELAVFRQHFLDGFQHGIEGTFRSRFGHVGRAAICATRSALVIIDSFCSFRTTDGRTWYTTTTRSAIAPDVTGQHLLSGTTPSDHGAFIGAKLGSAVLLVNHVFSGKSTPRTSKNSGKLLKLFRRERLGTRFRGDTQPLERGGGVVPARTPEDRLQLLAPQLETKLQYGGKGLRVRGMPFPRQGDKRDHGGIHLRRRIERTGPDHKAPLDPDIALDPDRQRAVVLGSPAWRTAARPLPSAP